MNANIVLYSAWSTSYNNSLHILSKGIHSVPHALISSFTQKSSLRRYIRLMRLYTCISNMSNSHLMSADRIHILRHERAHRTYYVYHYWTTANLDQPPISTHSFTMALPYLYPYHKICWIGMISCPILTNNISTKDLVIAVCNSL